MENKLKVYKTTIEWRSKDADILRWLQDKLENIIIDDPELLLRIKSISTVISKTEINKVIKFKEYPRKLKNLPEYTRNFG